MAKPNSREVVLPLPRGDRTEVSAQINVWCDPEGIGEIFRTLCRRFEIELVEGHVMPDHVHMCLGIPPKYSVANTIGKRKGKSAIMIHQKYGRKRNFVGLNFWSRGYYVSTVGLDEAMIRDYIRTQEEREKKEEQLQLEY